MIRLFIRNFLFHRSPWLEPITSAMLCYVMYDSEQFLAGKLQLTW